MKHIITILLSMGFVLAFGQHIQTTDFTEEMKKYDISDLWTHTKFSIEDDTITLEGAEPIGFIGENFQRFSIRFISAIQNPNNRLQYHIYGKTKVKESICTFQGTITIIESVFYYEDEFSHLKQGVARGLYEFYEDPDQKGTGILSGKFQTDFYINEKGEIKYNALWYGADGYSNNQFEGTWTSYKTRTIKKCNWGDFRIPDSRGLDVGAGEFFPNDDYHKFGWENYYKAWGYDSEIPGVMEARKREEEKWWLDR